MSTLLDMDERHPRLHLSTSPEAAVCPALVRPASAVGGASRPCGLSPATPARTLLSSDSRTPSPPPVDLWASASPMTRSPSSLSSDGCGGDGPIPALTFRLPWRGAVPAATPPAIAAGDVLLVKGRGRLAAIGAAGGLMGHVMLAQGAPRRLLATSPEAAALFGVRPLLHSEQLWRVEVFESTRSNVGLHCCELLLHPEHGTGRVVLVAELTKSSPGVDVPEETELLLIDDEAAEVWQSPPELRSELRPKIMSEVLREMKISEQSWSIATAARAMLKTATVRGRSIQGHLLQELKACWLEAPICTSVVVVFWQQYLCRLAQETSQDELDLILKWMPLKADRGLPSELIDTMSKCKWVLLDCPPGEDFEFCACRMSL